VHQDIIGTSAYTVSKTALEKAVKSISNEIYADNVTVNCIRLGYFNFGMISQVKNPMNIGGNSLGEIQDIAPTLISLLSEDSCNISGQIIEIIGGST
jgi:NAD(P)-dependent dehydrogenase (short-subunit alcohol dehydrogenase family)